MKIFKLLVLIFVSTSTFGQTNSLKSLTYALFCNAYTYEKADTATLRFLKNNFPYLARDKRKFPLVMSPFSENAIKSTVVMKFKRHPFFNFKIKEGQLNFNTMADTNIEPFVTSIELWLTFPDEKEANKSFIILADKLKKVSLDKVYSEQGDTKRYRFQAEGDSYGLTRKAELVLLKDENFYKIHFSDWYPTKKN